MRDARTNLEDQVGGLLGRGPARERKREVGRAHEAPPVAPTRYALTPGETAIIRATPAAGVRAA